LGQALVAHLRLIVRDKSRNRPTSPGPVAQHGSGTPVRDWARLLRCSECGVRDADFVVSGERR
jgi:hypothetical protein